MGWFLIGLVLGIVYGWLWVWLIFDPFGDDPPMPSDVRERDRRRHDLR